MKVCMISRFGELISEQEVSRFQSLKWKGHAWGRNIFSAPLSPAEPCHGAVVFKQFPGVQEENSKTSIYPYWVHSLKLSISCAVLWRVERICYREEEKAGGCNRMGRTGDVEKLRTWRSPFSSDIGNVLAIWEDSGEIAGRTLTAAGQLLCDRCWVMCYLLLFYHCTCNLHMHLYFIFIYYPFSEYLIWSSQAA